MKVHPHTSFQQATGRSPQTGESDRTDDGRRPRRSGAGKVRHEIRPQHEPQTPTFEAQGPTVLERIEVGNRVGTFLTANVERLTERFVNSDDYSEAQRREISGFIAGFQDRVGQVMAAFLKGEIDHGAVKEGVLEAFGSMNDAIRDAIAPDADAGGLEELHHGLEGIDVSA